MEVIELKNNMLCQICRKKRSTGHFVQLAFGKKYIDLYVCEDCAKKLLENSGIDLDNTDSVSFGDFLKIFFSQLDSNMIDKEKCPICGYSFENFQREGLLGCSSCYEVFKTKLEPIIINYQGYNKHIGKGSPYKERIPLNKETINSKMNNLSDLAVLKKELKKAIEDERFEDASVLRDKIRIIENGRNNQPTP